MEDTIEDRKVNKRDSKNGGKEKFDGRITSKMLLNRVKGRNGEN